MSESHYSTGDYFKSNYSDEVLFTVGSQSYITLGVCSTIVIGLNTDFRFGYDFQCGLAAKLELIAEEEFKNIPVAGRAFQWVDQVYAQSLEWVCGIRNRRATELTEISWNSKKTIGGWSFFDKVQFLLSATIPPIQNWSEFNEDSFFYSNANTIFGLPLNVQTKFLPWMKVDATTGELGGILSCVGNNHPVWGDAKVVGLDKSPWDYVCTAAGAVKKGLIFTYQISSTIWHFISGQAYQDLEKLRKDIKIEVIPDPPDSLPGRFLQTFPTFSIAPKCQSFYGEIHHQCFSIYSVSAAKISLEPSEALFIQTNGDDFEVSATFHNFM